MSINTKAIIRGNISAQEIADIIKQNYPNGNISIKNNHLKEDDYWKIHFKQPDDANYGFLVIGIGVAAKL